MMDLKATLADEYEKCLALIVETRRGSKRWLEIDQTTGQETDITTSHLLALEDTARSLARAMEEVGALDPIAVRPSKDWHFN